MPELAAAVAAVRVHTDRVPDLALVLGSGLGDLADAAEDAVALPTAEIPGYPRSTVQGHAGRLVFGTLSGRSVLFVQGRAHGYEGHPPRALGFPIRLAHALGARGIVLTNAAGGLRPEWPPGTLMLIEDHLALAALDPALGEKELNRRAKKTSPYDKRWIQLAEREAVNINLIPRRGVYVWTSGPSYETPAEIEFFRRIGGDAVGMSTAPEAVQAAVLGVPVLGISTITNLAAGLHGAPLDHDDVLEVGRSVHDNLAAWLRALVAATPL